MRRIAQLRYLKKLRQGQREACEALVCEHYKPIYRFMVYLTNDTDLAEDLTQETFTSAWTNIDSCRSLTSLASWLHQIAYHKFIDSRRVFQRKADLIDKLKQKQSEESRPCNPLYQLTMDEHKRMLYKAMHRLESYEYLVIVLHYIQGLSFREMGGILDKPVGTVKWQTNVALKNMKRFLDGRL